VLVDAGAIPAVDRFTSVDAAGISSLISGYERAWEIKGVRFLCQATRKWY
jgi:hypothetical protein